MTQPILLSAYVAKRCARRAHNDYDPTLTGVELIELGASTLQRIDAGIEFESRVRDLLRQRLGGACIDLTDVPWGQRSKATTDAVAAGVPVILGAAIPDDLVGRRRGLPDVLFRGPDRADGSPGYVPGDIKHHRVLTSSEHGHVSCTSADDPLPAAIRTVNGVVARTNYQFDDLAQLAHYYRMLQAIDWVAPGPALAAVIGADAAIDDTAAHPEVFAIWRDLDEALFRTFSRTEGTKLRSALERYDHEFDFRLAVVDVAARAADDPAPTPLVRPIIIRECESCPWYDYCLTEVGPNDASANTLIYRLDTREWLALDRIGVRTIDELANLSLDDSRLDNYWPEVTHRTRADKRLEGAIERAQLRVAAEWFRRTTTDRIDVPRADVEVDFDIEWDTDMGIYLWGFLVHDRVAHTTDENQPCDWGPMSTDARIAIAKSAIDYLVGLAQRSEAQGKSFLVYHYAPVEISNVKALITKVESPELPTVEEWTEFTNRYFCDLLPIVKQNFIGVAGHGLKVIATKGAGFQWRDEDPGGLQSQDWLVDARGDDSVIAADARRRLCEYNHDDVQATAAVREWLSSLD
ncbi:MAG: TM0106 family RecB-like putative nuclease [Candidatus Nanopelagicales bacterium]